MLDLSDEFYKFMIFSTKLVSDRKYCELSLLRVDMRAYQIGSPSDRHGEGGFGLQLIWKY